MASKYFYNDICPAANLTCLAGSSTISSATQQGPRYGDLGGGASDFFMGMESKIWQLLKEEKCVL